MTAMKPLLYVAIFLAAAWIAANHYRATQRELPTARRSSANIIREQATAFEHGRAIIACAFWYAGNTNKEPKPGHRALAVDVVIEDTEAGFDLDDIEVVNGRSNESYGSFPHIRYLDAEGNVTGELATSANGRRASFRLIYMIPESTQSIKLRYWDKDMHGPVQIRDAPPDANEGVAGQSSTATTPRLQNADSNLRRAQVKSFRPQVLGKTGKP